MNTIDPSEQAFAALLQETLEEFQRTNGDTRQLQQQLVELMRTISKRNVGISSMKASLATTIATEISSSFSALGNRLESQHDRHHAEILDALRTPPAKLGL